MLTEFKQTPTKLKLMCRSITFQILEDVDDFLELMPGTNETGEPCSFWMDTAPPSKHEAFDSFLRFWEEQILTDLTLLVGPDQTSIKVHKLILATNFEYFHTMFTGGLMESSQNEVRLPCVSPEDFKLILKYAYSGRVHLVKENVWQMTVLANYFGCKNLLDRGCEFIKSFTNVYNCVCFLEVAFRLDINQLKKDLLLFVTEYVAEVDKDDLSALPVELLLEIIQHPAAVMDHGDPSGNEKGLFRLVWNQLKSFPPESKTEYIPKLLKAIHLPLTDKYFLFFLLREVGDIPQARELIMRAGEEIDPAETTEWYLERYSNMASVKVSRRDKALENGYRNYSRCVLIKGFPFYVYAVFPCYVQDNTCLIVDSPVAIEHLELPFKVIVSVKPDSDWEWSSVNTYHNGIVHKSTVRTRYFYEQEVSVKVEFQS